MRSASPTICAAVLASLVACGATPTSPADSALLSAAPARPEAVGTVLVSLLLSPEGEAVIDALSPRSFAYVGPLADFHPVSAGAPAMQGSGGPLVTPNPGVRSAPGGIPTQPLPLAPRVASASTLTRYALVVSHATLTSAVVVPLALGPPGGAHGDVADPWDHGGLILRAPHYGAGTQVELVASDSLGTRRLAMARLDVSP